MTVINRFQVKGDSERFVRKFRAHSQYLRTRPDFDFLVTPAAAGEAPATLRSTGTSEFNRIWTLLGVPCITLPGGAGPSGLPLGVQFAGRRNEDMQLLGWADRAFSSP